MAESWSFTGDTFEDIIDKGVHDTHRLRWDTNIGMNLLQNFEDVCTIALFSGLSPLHYPGLALASFSFLCRTFSWTLLRTCLLRALGWTRLSACTHFSCFVLNVTRNNEMSWDKIPPYLSLQMGSNLPALVDFRMPDHQPSNFDKNHVRISKTDPDRVFFSFRTRS